MFVRSRIRAVAGILVGGRSSRMGRPKATLPMPNGRMMIEHVAGVASQLGDWVEEVVILGRSPVALPRSMAGLRTLPDPVPGGGPLAGLCSLLANAGQRWGLLLACDLPCVSPRLLDRLRQAAHPHTDVLAFASGAASDTVHPCCALYHPRLLDAASQALMDGRLRMQDLIALAKCTVLDLDPMESRYLLNMNRPADYHALSERSDLEVQRPTGS